MISLAPKASDWKESQTETSDATADATAEAAVQGLRVLIRTMRASNSAAERSDRVTDAQLLVLQALATEPGQSVNDLAKRSLTTQSSVSEVLARLIDQGFITRRVAADDRRRAELFLTPRGSVAVATARDRVQDRLIQAFGRLSEEEQSCLGAGLSRWLTEAGVPVAESFSH